MQKTTIILFLLFISLISFGQNLSSNSTGSFTYIPQSPLNNKSIEVFYHITAGDVTKMPILFSFHGVNRNADDYRDYWISMANNNQFMVFAPKFSDDDFPTGDQYNLANIFDDGDNPSSATFNQKAAWTFSTIDPIFETIKTAVSGTQEKYNAWGHSAGAQFLQRFVLYLPDSKLDVAICSNAGWYTVPESTVNFPYGIKNGQLPNTDLTKAFSKKLIVHLGQNDTNPNAGLRRNTIVDEQQGTNRLVRGRYYFNTAQTTALNMGATFNWQKHEVSGVGHDPQLMANDALQYLLSSLLSTNHIDVLDDFKVYPNPTKGKLYFKTDKIIPEVKLYSLAGRLLKSTRLQQEINLEGLPSGIYFLDVNNRKIKIVKI